MANDTQRPRPTIGAVIGSIILVIPWVAIGLFFIIWAFHESLSAIQLRQRGRETFGVVTDIREEWHDVVVEDEVSDDKGRVTRPERREPRLFYRSQITVKRERETAEIWATRIEQTPLYPLGSEVKVLYYPGRLREGKIESELLSHENNLVVACLGVMSLMLSVFGMRVTLNKSLPEEYQKSLLSFFPLSTFYWLGKRGIVGWCFLRETLLRMNGRKE